jgi:hypothetical protein
MIFRTVLRLVSLPLYLPGNDGPRLVSGVRKWNVV